jgi:sarcosine oxidase
MKYDVIVIGVGSMGSATAFHLAARKCRVLGLEQFNIGHDLGSGHGVNRIIRLAYFEHPAYVPLLRRAYHLWRELQKLSGERLLFLKGSIDAGPEDGQVVRGSLRSCREHHLKHEPLEAAELNRRYPGWRLPKTMAAVFQPQGGFVLCERAMIAYITAAQALGAEIRARETVNHWEVNREEVLVHTDRETYRAKRLVITAGAWASKLVETLQVRRLAEPQRQVLIWTQPKAPELFRLENFPVFNLECKRDQETDRYYGFPIYGIPGFKLGKYYHRREAVDPDTMNRNCDAEDESVLREAIREFFPKADGPTMAMKTCMFSNSLDKHFVLDRHPDFPQVSVAAGFSGHGFKFASVVGEIMADLALEGRSSRFPDLSLFKITQPRIESD